MSLIDVNENDNIEIRSEKKIFKEKSVPPEIKYEVKIDEYFDLVFIDGPSLQIDGEKRKDAINSNVLDLDFEPKIIVIDVRKSTAEYLSNKYKNDYKVYLSDLFTGKPLESGYKYFSILIKK